ncbi:hypothetical protein Ppro_2706 [Pelobacter propionicus DSM 2379]|uniref:Uncharacterized protein n=1 Tax=Pelobacter propionicus (strain DSM 2379 / NBRC 103807 / OttBd1) TaxID=338966 RepID=A1ASI8_PELPD|nr:hypothetical protein Ppro_2706 [Pelobacter propionicus DSM 2379]
MAKCVVCILTNTLEHGDDNNCDQYQYESVFYNCLTFFAFYGSYPLDIHFCELVHDLFSFHCLIPAQEEYHLFLPGDGGCIIDNHFQPYFRLHPVPPFHSQLAALSGES